MGLLRKIIEYIEEHVVDVEIVPTYRLVEYLSDGYYERGEPEDQDVTEGYFLDRNADEKYYNWNDLVEAVRIRLEDKCPKAVPDAVIATYMKKEILAIEVSQTLYNVSYGEIQESLNFDHAIVVEPKKEGSGIIKTYYSDSRRNREYKDAREMELQTKLWLGNHPEEWKHYGYNN